MARLATLAILSLLGCVTTKAVRLNPATAQYAPVDADSVRLYTSPEKIPVKYEEVAVIYAKGDEDWTNEEQMMKAVRKKAGQMGCNGVLLSPMQDPTTAQKVWKALLGTSANRKAQVVCVRVTPQSSSP